jgi:hypothetical protein
MFIRKFLVGVAALLFVCGLVGVAPDRSVVIKPTYAFTHGAPPAIPSFATAFGFTSYLIFDNFNSLATVDTTQSNAAGFNWYTANQAAFKVDACPTSTSQASWYSVTNGVLAVSSNNAVCQGAQNMSIGTASAIRTLPLISGSKGFYIEGRMKFALPTGGQDFIPDFWLQDSAGAVAQMNGSGAFRFGEIDILEARPTNTQQTVNDWSSWNTRAASPTSGADLSALDYTQFHRWGVLMVPMSLNGGTGFVKWYVDGVQTGSAITWTSAGQTGGILESDNFEINFAAGVNIPLSIDYIFVATSP